MFEVRNALKASFETIDNLEVISSSWKTARQELPLPAIVVDLESVFPGTTLESGEVETRQHTIPCSLHVPLNQSDDDAEAALESLMESVEDSIALVYGNQYAINDWFPHVVLWGNGQALCGAFSIVIEI
ncbi:MAG TPA: hypothetical protein VGM92_03870 [Candidatus Kapabacteria bacterium]|jgi:hypothetical protein